VAYTSAELITIIGVFFTGLTGLVAAIFAGIAALRAKEVRSEVKTLNAKTIGVLAGEQETRRIVDIPAADRTFSDQQHLHDVPPS
jgi:ABC-type lipopolysaccharide export system ATPase subunit